MTKTMLQLQKKINKQLNKKNKAKRRWLLSLIVLLAVLAIVSFVWIYQNKATSIKAIFGDKTDSYDFTISFLDVGEGNACLIKCGGEAMLVDTGYYEHLEKLKKALDEQGVSKFKYVVATHPDADHIGSMGYLLMNYETELFLMSDATNDTTAYDKMLEAIDAKNISIDIPDFGATYTLGSASIGILSTKKEYDNVNDYSLVLRITYEGKSFLIMGDASSSVEDEILARKKNIESDVILLGHHGSSDSSSERFLKKVKPVDAVVSCGKDNDYGHPHKETLKLLEKRNINCYRTDMLGNISYGIKAGDEILYRLWDDQ